MAPAMAISPPAGSRGEERPPSPQQAPRRIAAKLLQIRKVRVRSAGTDANFL